MVFKCCLVVLPVLYCDTCIVIIVSASIAELIIIYSAVVCLSFLGLRVFNVGLCLYNLHHRWSTVYA